MSTQSSFPGFHKSHPRVIMPPEDGLLSHRLHNLAGHHKRTSEWWSAEVKKLVRPALDLESKVKRNMQLGFGVGLAAGLVLAFYLGAVL